MKPTFIYPIQESENGISVEKLLLSLGYSRKLIIDLKKSPDYLTIKGEHVYITRTLRTGDILTVRLPEEPSSENIVKTDIPLDIVYEDDDLMVINKQANLPIHPSQGNYDNTLANGIAWYFSCKGEPFVYRVINRLDRDTTGLLILAKHALSACILSDMVRKRLIHRTYLAAARGDIRIVCPEGTGVIDAPIARVAGSTIERQVDFERGETARTHFKILSYHSATDSTLTELQLETGRTHQIRVHLKYLGFPLFGDFLYNPDYRFISRQSLHSWKLDFSHPITGTSLHFEAEIPDDMKIFTKAPSYGEA
ncbi:MAG: RluA family pseudouridine synthase [Brotaphodocola sp.]